MKIVLIGFMGAGKSTVSRIVAQSLDYALYENDEELLKLSDCQSIPQIFEKHSEEFFRELERKSLLKGLATSNTVLSPGGGIIESKENREALRASGAKIIYLDADFDTIVTRIGSASNRPIFKDENIAKERFQKRSPLYREIADIIIPTSHHNEEMIAEIVLRFLGKQESISDTKLHCVIGDPVGQSLSPAIHNNAFREQGIGSQNLYCGYRCDVSELKSLCEILRKGDFKGVSCTLPHKVDLLPLLDEQDNAVRDIGAVNTLVINKGKLHGYNTDYLGIVNPIKNVTSIAEKKVSLIGAGGTARAALYGLKKESALITIFNRDVQKGKILAEEFGVESQGLENIKAIKDSDIILNTTSVGMVGLNSGTLVPKEYISSNMIVMDAIYKPQYTTLLLEAKEQGARVIPGMEMFIEQAIAQYELWTGENAPVHTMREVVTSSFS